MRLMIEVDDAIEVVQDVVALPLSMFGSLCDMLEANAVDAEPVKHSEWKYYHKKGMLWAERQSALDTHDWERLRECERCLFLLTRVHNKLVYEPVMGGQYE